MCYFWDLDARHLGGINTLAHVDSRVVVFILA